MTEALLLLFLKGKLGEKYNIGTGQNYRNIDIAKKILKIAKKNFSGKLNKNQALIFGIVLSLLSIVGLYYSSNLLSAVILFITISFYVFIFRYHGIIKFFE